MNMTAHFKQWLIDQKLVAADETKDEVFLKAASEAIVSGALTTEKLVELQTDKKMEESSKLVALLEGISEGVKTNADAIKDLQVAKTAAPGPVQTAAPVQPVKLVDGAPKMTEVVAPAELGVSEKGTGGTQIREIGIQEQFDDAKSPMKFPARTSNGGSHPKSGQLMTEGSRVIYESSDLDKAISGAWFKYVIQSETNGRGVPAKLRPNDQDKKLLDYALHERKWGGMINATDEENGMEVKNAHLSSLQQKQVVDDLASGGLEIAPIAFDDAVITFPLLYGELYPKVNLKTITRGRRIEGASITNVDMQWGGGDDTAITLHGTAGFIEGFDTMIHVIDGAIEIGLDLMSDASVDIGPIITDSYGRRLLSELDGVIATGSGVGRPTGIMIATGTTAVASANGVGGPPTVGDYEGLLFGVPKEYKAGHPKNAYCFCANETTYARSRGIAVGATDERRVYGMTHEDYALHERPYAINGTMTNSQIFAGVLPRYRMYRRLGLTMRASTEGSTLIRRNILLMTARARFGGQIEDGAAFAVMTDAQN